MQFNVAFIVTALCVSAAPAMAASFTFYQGADCTGTAIGTLQTNTPDCVYVTNGGSARSIGYSGVPIYVDFYLSGGGHDECTNGAYAQLGGGSGCGTAPPGYNYESVSWA